MKITGPIAAADIWLPVMEAAGHQCQCTGACGKRHLDANRKPSRCPHENRMHISGVGEIRLIAAPEDVTTAYPPPGAELLAWCPPCFDGRRRLAKRAVRAAPPQPEGLFDADEFHVSTASKKQADVGRA